MPKVNTVAHIEHEIESLPLAQRKELLSWMQRTLRVSAGMEAQRKKLTDAVNRVYGSEDVGVDKHLIKAQLASLERDEW